MFIKKPKNHYFEDFNKMFDDIYGDAFSSMRSITKSLRDSSGDIVESPSSCWTLRGTDEYKSATLDIDLPGVKKADISVEVEDGKLEVTSKRGQNTSYVTYKGPPNGRLQDATAVLEDGVLRISVPCDRPRPNRTSITVK